MTLPPSDPAVSIPPDASARLLDGLRQETAETVRFAILLEDEARTLETGEPPEALQALAARKTEAAARLAELAARRDALLAGLGLPAGREGVGRAARGDAGLARAWSQLCDVSERARGLNLRNGTLIDTHLRHVRRSLEILHGVAGTGRVYDAKGRHRPLGGGKAIAAT